MTAPHTRADRTCLCGKPHCVDCGEVFPCRRFRAPTPTGFASDDDLIEDLLRELRRRHTGDYLEEQ